MYSVIIQNQKTIELFQEFHPLFMESMNNGEVGVCRWMEPGTTVDTALPELTKMIEDKEEWRAIIVNIVDEEEMSKYARNRQNPFDFEYYHEERAYHESPIPLVRLTNMLGEIPVPDIHYEVVTVQEEFKSPKIVYRPKKSENEEQIYQDLVEKYDYDGKAPSEIVLISVRAAQKEKKENVERHWTNYKEIDSSNFWKRNSYSTQCRFVVYDIKKQGNVEYVADMFKFWTAVLLLAKNKIDTDELQAYRLYKVNIGINRGILESSIQKTVNRMQGARQYMEQMIHNENMKELQEERQLPNYKIEVPVIFDTPKNSDMLVEPTRFSLIAGDVKDDLKQWNNVKRNAEYKLRNAIDKAEIALDESAERMRNLTSMRETEVFKIDKYQSRMMDSELKNLYHMIQHLQQNLPDSQNIIGEDMRRKADDVRESILARIPRTHIKGIIAIMLLLIGLTFVPGIIIYSADNIGNRDSLISFVLLALDIFVIPIALMVWQQKKQIKEMLERYNQALSMAARRIIENSELYSNFLSCIASHSRGKSYFHILKNKTFFASNKHKTIEIHMRAIDVLIDTLEKWSRAFYLDVNLNPRYYEDNEFEMRIKPAQNRLYTLEYGGDYQIPLNKSGEMINSSYEYITKIELIREELYD